MRLRALLCLAALARAAAIVATVSSGAIRLSSTSVVSGSSFVIDQADVSNAGYPFWIDLRSLPRGWDAQYSCPSGACDAATYAVKRAQAGSTGSFSITYTSSAFQNAAVPFGPVGGAASGSLSFARQTQPSYWAYGVSLGILGTVAAINSYASTQV
jgi:hypothetical protein